MPLLQSQLQRPFQKVHLLLDDNYGIEVLLQIALEGLTKLELESELFTEECHLFGLDLKQELIQFMNQLVPHLNTTEGLKCIDFLIRKYNLLNLDLVYLLLPYHEKPWFPKLLTGMKDSLLVTQLKHCKEISKPNLFKVLNETELRQIIDFYLQFVTNFHGYPMLYSSYASIIVKIQNIEFIAHALSQAIRLQNDKLITASCFALGQVLTVQSVPFPAVSNVFSSLLQLESKSALMMAVFIIKRISVVLDDATTPFLLSKSSAILELPCNVSHCIPMIFQISAATMHIPTLLSLFKSRYSTEQMAKQVMDLFNDELTPDQLELATFLNNKYALHSKSLSINLYGHDINDQITALNALDFSTSIPDLLNLIQFATPRVIVHILHKLTELNDALAIAISALCYHTDATVVTNALVVLKKHNVQNGLSLYNAVTQGGAFKPDGSVVAFCTWFLEAAQLSLITPCAILIPHLSLAECGTIVSICKKLRLSADHQSLLVSSMLMVMIPHPFLIKKTKSDMSSPSPALLLINDLANWVDPTDLLQLAYDRYDFYLYFTLLMALIMCPIDPGMTKSALNALLYLDAASPNSALKYFVGVYKVSAPYKLKQKSCDLNLDAHLTTLFKNVPTSPTELLLLALKYTHTGAYCALLLEMANVTIQMVKECFIRNQFHNEMDLLKMMTRQVDVDDLLAFISGVQVLQHPKILVVILREIEIQAPDLKYCKGLFDNYMNCEDGECVQYYRGLLTLYSNSDLLPFTAEGGPLKLAALYQQMTMDQLMSDKVCLLLDRVLLNSSSNVVTRCLSLLLDALAVGLGISVNQIKLLNAFKQHQHVHIHQQILQIYCHLIELWPIETLEHVSSIFVLLSASNMYKCDDDYNYNIIHSFLVNVVCADASGGDDLVSLFVDAFEHIPGHRRLSLFTTLLQHRSELYLPLFHALGDVELFLMVLGTLAHEIALPLLPQLPIEMVTSYLQDRELRDVDYELTSHLLDWVIAQHSETDLLDLLCQAMHSDLLCKFLSTDRVLPFVLDRIKQQHDFVFLSHLGMVSDPTMLLNIMISSCYASDYDSAVIQQILPHVTELVGKVQQLETTPIRKLLHLVGVLVNHEEIQMIPVALNLIRDIHVSNDTKQRHMQLIMILFKFSHFIGGNLHLLWLQLLPMIHEYHGDVTELHPRLHVGALLKIKEEIVKIPTGGISLIFELVHDMIKGMDKQTFIVHHLQLKELFLFVLTRSEADVGKQFVSFCLKLNDALFKPIFMEMVELLHAYPLQMIGLLQEYCIWMKQLFSPYAQLIKSTILDIKAPGMLLLYGLILNYTDSQYFDNLELKKICNLGFENGDCKEKSAFFGFTLMSCKQAWTFILPKLNDMACSEMEGLAILKEMTVVMGANYNEILQEVLPSIAEAMDYHEGYCRDELIPAIEGATHANVMDLLK